jgi:hypothetical protein
MHLHEDDLVLHYYGEMESAEDARLLQHLEACAACHASYRRLQRVLAIVDDAATAGPELPEHFERSVWARLEPNLPLKGRGWFAWLVLSPARVAWMAAVVLLVGAAFMAGRMTPKPAGTDAAASSAQIRERILLVDLGEHLDRSQMVLVELVSTENGKAADISAERQRAEELVAANRLYRQTAVATGDSAIASLLDELDAVLVDVAAGPKEISSQALDEMRQRIESRSLLFKVRVVSSQVRDRQQSAIPGRTGQRSAL